MFHFESSVAAICQICVRYLPELIEMVYCACEVTATITLSNIIIQDKAYFPSAMNFESPLYCPNEVPFGDCIAIRIQPPPLPVTSFSRTIEKPAKRESKFKQYTIQGQKYAITA